MRHDASLVLLVMFALSFAVVAHAADAVFSQDGTRVYFAAGLLKVLDLSKPDHLTEIPDSALFGGEQINAVTCAQNGKIVCMSAHHLTLFDPARQTFSRFSDVETTGPREFRDVAYNPHDALLLLTADETHDPRFNSSLKMMCFRDQQFKQYDVFDRRAEEVIGPIFDRDGTLYFSNHGDLWQRVLDTSELVDKAWEAPPRAVLIANRIAPLARQETYEGTPEGTGVLEIAPCGALLYIQTQRWHGTGYGSIVVTPKPVEVSDFSDGEYKDFVKILSSIRIVDTVGAASFLCASRDGTKVLYCSYEDTYLIFNGGKPQKLPLKRDEILRGMRFF